jgi:hypothetical protein
MLKRTHTVSGVLFTRSVLSRFSKVNLGIVANIQTPAFALNFGITSNERLGKHYIRQVGKRPESFIME